MPAPPELSGREAFHFVHLKNIDGIIKHGLLSNTKQKAMGLTHHSIAISDIQKVRSGMQVTCGPKGVVHDYVPFYFTKLSLMLLNVVNAKNVDQPYLIHLAVPIDLIDKPNVVFTDASANREGEPPNFFEDPGDLRHLLWDQIDANKWPRRDDEFKHEKMAEMLIHRKVPWTSISRIVVWNEESERRIRRACKRHGVKAPQIDFDGYGDSHYYTRFMFGESDTSLVSGPIETRMLLNEAIKDVKKNRRNRESKTYRNLAHLRTSLRSDLSCLAETAELIGLKSTNFSPPLDLGDHTIDVASKLRGLPEFRKLHAGDQLLTELAAYFHDVGKGPKQKWAKTGGHYRDDRNHPVEALPMVTRILSEEVTEIRSTRSIRLILKLVCYHDLIGDIFGKGRKPEQLSEIVSDERELDMLIALSKADILSVRAKWWDAAKLYLLRKKVVADLQAKRQEDA